MYLIQILKDKINAQEWQEQLSTLRPEEAFLEALLPIVNHIYYVALDLKSTLRIVHQKMSAQTLKRTIFEHIKQDVAVVIMRVCIFEMHDAKANGYLTEDTSEKRFKQFVRMLCETANIVAIFEKYPVLNNLLSQYFLHYQDFIQTFLQQLNNEYQSIAACFFESFESSELIEIQKAGDRHRQGRSVLILKFQDPEGKIQKIVYKPRSLSIDIAYNVFLDWINSISDIGFRYAAALDFKSHGWCQFIEHRPCNTVEEVRLFYTRLGGVLTISHVLNIGDLHFENLFANGDCPVIIDHECIASIFFSLTIKKQRYQRHKRTVLDTLILPNRLYPEGMESESFDLSAFAGAGGQVLPQEGLVVIHAGTDEMTVKREKGRFGMQSNLPKLNDEQIDTMFYHSYFLNGFESIYTLLLKHKKFLLGKGSPLGLFKSVETRVLFRPTVEYAKLLYESFHPSLLHSKKAFFKHFQWLAESKEMYPNLNFLEVIQSEEKDLYGLDIPLFLHYTNENVVRDSRGNVIAGKMFFSGYKNILEQIKGLGDNDLLVQKTIIVQSLLASEIGKKGYPVSSEKPEAFLTTISDSKQIQKNKNALMKKAIAILDFLTIHAYEDEGVYYWPYLSPTGEKHWGVNITSLELYNGLLGIMLVYAYGYFLSKNKVYLKWIKKFFLAFECGLKTFNKKANFGAYSGLGAFLYFTIEMYRLKLISKQKKKIWIKKITAHFDNYFKNTGDAFDIIGGSSGYLISLLATKEELDPKLFKRQANACVKHLLKICPTPDSLAALIKIERYKNKTILGMAHGVIGVAFVLQEFTHLFRHSAASGWVKKAIKMIENTYDNEHKNWPDTVGQGVEKLNFSSSWCYGTVGQGIFRCLLSRHCPSIKVNKELKICVDRLIQNGLSSAYNLCHGNMATFDFFLMAEDSKVLPENFTISQADVLLSNLANIEKIQSEHIGEAFIPGLMIGLSGVAYELMRIAHPAMVRSVLSFGLL